MYDSLLLFIEASTCIPFASLRWRRGMITQEAVTRHDFLRNIFFLSDDVNEHGRELNEIIMDILKCVTLTISSEV